MPWKIQRLLDYRQLFSQTFLITDKQKNLQNNAADSLLPGNLKRDFYNCKVGGDEFDIKDLRR
jgi:hypothetical protein